MSSREPIWYCHECHSEMRPLMVPDPHCASCNGTFVEKLDNPADDPREFQHAADGDFEDDALPGDMDAFLAGLRTLLGGRAPSSPPTTASGTASTPSSPGQPGSNRSDHPNMGFTIRVQNSGPGMRTVIIGGSPRQSGTDHVPSLTEYNTRNQDTITGPLMAQYLLAMLSQRARGEGGANPLQELFGNLAMFGPGAEGAENGRWGDYVFNQEALDQIITQIMENANASAPVPATQELMDELPREVLEEGSALLEKDCAVCKEQFKTNTEDPDEQIVVTLPCKHPFHEGCILPWLKSSGTCPVCRFQLVPQPEHHAPGPGPPRGSGSGGHPPSGSTPPRGGANPPRPSSAGGSGSQPHTGSGLFNFFHFGGGHGNQQSGEARPASHAASTSVPSRSNTRYDHHDFPGAWGDSWGDQVD